VDRDLQMIRDADGRIVLSFLTMPNGWRSDKRAAILRRVAACVNVCGALDVAALEGIVVAGKTIEVALRASLTEGVFPEGAEIVTFPVPGGQA